MPCYTSKLPVGRYSEMMGDHGTKVTICGRLGKHCADCGDVGHNLCDYPVGARGRTCDRPICNDHSHQVGPNMHYCETHFRMWQKTAERQGVLPLDL